MNAADGFRFAAFLGFARLPAFFFAAIERLLAVGLELSDTGRNCAFRGDNLRSLPGKTIAKGRFSEGKSLRASLGGGFLPRETSRQRPRKRAIGRLRTVGRDSRFRSSSEG